MIIIYILISGNSHFKDMYVDDIIKKLSETSIRYGNVDYCRLDTVTHYLKDIGNKSIMWSEDDFLHMARLLKDDEWDQWYNKESFEEALHAMINDHDAMVGISWYHVEIYLNKYCKIKSDPMKL